ncbi:MAG: hypothetical protein HYV63_23305 [Candidatus Schekmanbacteria bacterium]|nr:hypothetical protein [Candidatus Schekmanbacteria bacterium]
MNPDAALMKPSRPFATPLVRAILGPTNTGKTYRAIQQMLTHHTGMLGLPLRLLAREVYDRVAAQVGERAVALITGEERRAPRGARYFVCTVESMPLDHPVDFLAVDEIQLAGSRQRGHVFTDRLLRARGTRETMFLGSDTIAPLLKALLPHVAVERYERFSRLSYAGRKRLGAMPRRSAIVAFSAAHVYELAEQMRGRYGGTAVVLGALSPRTRNAQVAMYQAGDVQHLVATDAIGMGLNMDLNHVALAGTQKFDGNRFRELEVDELAQIAGRAGRYKRDGTFGVTGALEGLPGDVVAAIEHHEFPRLQRVYYRNSDLAFDTLANLLRSLDAPAPRDFLIAVHDGDDHEALRRLARLEDVQRRATSPNALRLLWEVASIPDYRQSLTNDHTEMLADIFRQLTDSAGRLDDEWIARRIGRLDNCEGDLDLLMTRIAWIRTWTYITHRSGWVADPEHWQERSRAIEDRLSDALHAQLTQRFVDQRVALIAGSGGGRGAAVEAGVTPDGTVRAGGAVLGRLIGFRFELDRGGATALDRALQKSVRQIVEPLLQRRVAALVESEHDAFALDEHGRVCWRGVVVARLEAGPEPLQPKISLVHADDLDAAARGRIRGRLLTWSRELAAEVLGPLNSDAASALAGAGRGLLAALAQSLGVVCQRTVAEQVGVLHSADRKTLARLGVRLGVRFVYAQPLLQPVAQRVRLILWCLHRGLLPALLPPIEAEAMMTPPESATDAWLLAAGYTRVGPRALRVDAYERLTAELRELARQGPFALGEVPSRWLGLTAPELGELMPYLGFERMGQVEAAARAGSGPPAGSAAAAPRYRRARQPVRSP